MVGINDSKCVLVIGATSGIGRALALAIHALESKPIVIVAGRRQARLDEIATDNDKDCRLKSVCVDISAGKDALKKFVESILGEYPKVCLTTTGDIFDDANVVNHYCMYVICHSLPCLVVDMGILLLGD